MPKIVDHEQRKREIVTKALEVFSQSGYHDANLLKIASQCGYSRTTLYKYFKNKDEIFYFALESLFSKLEYDSQAVAQSYVVPIIDRIKEVFKTIIDDFTENRNSAFLLLDLWSRLKHENTPFAEKLRKRTLSLNAVFESLLEEGMKNGTIKMIDTRAMSFALLSLAESYIIHAVISGPISMEAGLNSLTILLSGLGQ